MTESERLLRSILGPTRSDIRPLAFAIAVAEELLFNQGLAMDDVQITKQIYPMVARQFRKTDNAAAKCVERLSRLCWEAMVAQDLVAQYLGRAIQQSPTPRSVPIADDSFAIVLLMVTAKMNAIITIRMSKSTPPMALSEPISSVAKLIAGFE